MAKKEPKAASGSSTRKIIASGSSKRIGDIKQVKPGSMAGNSKMVTPKAKAKASTSYSPKPMTAIEKRAAGFRGATTQYQTQLKKKAKEEKAATASRLKATKYSPAPMTDKQKKAAALKGAKKQASIGIKKDLTKIAGTAGKVAGAVSKRAKTTAREARDVVTAVGSVAKGVQENRKFYTGRTLKNLANQVAETGKAAVTGKKGTESNQVKNLEKYYGYGSSAMFKGLSRDKAKNKPGTSVAKVISDYEKMLLSKKQKRK